MGNTCTSKIGHGNINHNLRLNDKDSNENINRELTQYNVVYESQHPREAYERVFDEAVKEYNEKQRATYHEDRVIKNYYDHVAKSRVTTKRKNPKTGKYKKANVLRQPFEEIMIMIGGSNQETDHEKCKAILDVYMRGDKELGIPSFKERYPQFDVFCAVMHVDEATPHLHIDFIPVAYKAKKGLKTQMSFNQSMKEMGFVLDKSKHTGYKDIFYEKEREFIKEISMQVAGLEIVKDDKVRTFGELTDAEYKAEMDAQKVQEYVKNDHRNKEVEKALGLLERTPTMNKVKFKPEEVVSIKNVLSNDARCIQSLLLENKELMNQNYNLESSVRSWEYAYNSKVKELKEYKKTDRHINKQMVIKERNQAFKERDEALDKCDEAINEVNAIQKEKEELFPDVSIDLFDKQNIKKLHESIKEIENESNQGVVRPNAIQFISELFKLLITTLISLNKKLENLTREKTNTDKAFAVLKGRHNENVTIYNNLVRKFNTLQERLKDYDILKKENNDLELKCKDLELKNLELLDINIEQAKTINQLDNEIDLMKNPKKRFNNDDFDFER